LDGQLSRPHLPAIYDSLSTFTELQTLKIEHLMVPLPPNATTLGALTGLTTLSLTFREASVELLSGLAGLSSLVNLTLDTPMSLPQEVRI
jgi:hypothetical protein